MAKIFISSSIISVVLYAFILFFSIKNDVDPEFYWLFILINAILIIYMFIENILIRRNINLYETNNRLDKDSLIVIEDKISIYDYLFKIAFIIQAVFIPIIILLCSILIKDKTPYYLIHIYSFLLFYVTTMLVTILILTANLKLYISRCLIKNMKNNSNEEQ